MSLGDSDRKLSVDLNAKLDSGNILGQLPRDSREMTGPPMFVGIFYRREKIFAISPRSEARAVHHIRQRTYVNQIRSQSDRVLEWKITSHLELLISALPGFGVSCDVQHRPIVDIEPSRR